MRRCRSDGMELAHACASSRALRKCTDALPPSKCNVIMATTSSPSSQRRISSGCTRVCVVPPCPPDSSLATTYSFVAVWQA